MKLSVQLLISVLAGAASAAPDGIVYLFQGQQWPSTSSPPTLSPEEARLIFAQRLGVSQYHDIGHASESTLANINTFGGHQESLFQDLARDKTPELVFLVQGLSAKTAEPLLSAWQSIKPAFVISNPPSAKANLGLIKDLRRQLGQAKECDLLDAINPFEDKCWNGRANAVYLDLQSDHTLIEDFIAAQERFIEFANNNQLNVMVVFMPDSASTKSAKQYGSYAMPSQVPIGRRQVEEPMTELPSASSAAFKFKQVMASNLSNPLELITGVPPVCHSSLESCMSSTNNCSGHGDCYMKYPPAKGEDAAPGCYACGCSPSVDRFLDGDQQRPSYRHIYWGGAACQKKDVSGPFWLIAIFTVVMIGLVSWSIGMLFSIGEETLPGVIGAGVPVKSR